MSSCLYVSEIWNHSRMCQLLFGNRTGRRLGQNSIADDSYYKIGCYLVGGRNYKPYLTLPLYLFLSASFWCVRRSFVLLILCVLACELRRLMEVTISKHVIHQHLTNPYLTQTPSVAGTPSSFLFFFFCVFVCVFQFRWNLQWDFCVGVCLWSWSGGEVVPQFESRERLTVRIGQCLSTMELRKIGLSLMTFSSIVTCTALLPTEND